LGNRNGEPHSPSAQSVIPDPPERWSRRVSTTSNALDLQPGMFTWNDPRLIAASLKRSAERSQRRKGTPFASAMAMLTFYINRAGNKLPVERRQLLEQAKAELRLLFGRAPRSS
jgi:hypothetical protein